MRKSVATLAALTMLALAVAIPASAHTQSLTIDPQATLEPGGLGANVSGTVVCSTGHLATINVQLSQFRHGQLIAQGSGSTPQFMCSGITQQWSVRVFSFGAPFKKGTASARADSFTQGADGFESRSEFGQVNLR
jgi:hypothetical protein